MVKIRGNGIPAFTHFPFLTLRSCIGYSPLVVFLKSQTVEGLCSHFEENDDVIVAKLIASENEEVMVRGREGEGKVEAFGIGVVTKGGGGESLQGKHEEKYCLEAKTIPTRSSDKRVLRVSFKLLDDISSILRDWSPCSISF